MLFLLVFGASATAAPTRPGGQEPEILETEAHALSKRWTGASFRRSIVLFGEAARVRASRGEAARAVSCLLEAARLQAALSDLGAADGTLERASRITRSHRLRDEMIRVLSMRSEISLLRGRVHDSKIHYRSALDLSRASLDRGAVALAHLSAGEHNYAYGDADETRRHFLAAVSHAEAVGDRELVARGRLNLGFAFIRLGDPASASREAASALEIWRAGNDPRGIALGSLGLGFVHALSGEKQLGLEYYKRARDSFPDDVDWIENAKARNGLATVYEEYGEFGLAGQLRREALELYGKAGYRYGELATLPSLAELEARSGDEAAAEALHDRAEDLAGELGDAFHLAVIEEGRGNISLAAGRLDRAERNYLAAHRTYERLNLKFPRVLGLLGRVCEKKGELGRARKYFESALRAFRLLRDGLSESQALHDLALLDLREGRPDDALERARLSVDLSERHAASVLNSKLTGTYFSNVYARYELLIGLLVEKSRRTGERGLELAALETSEKARARSMLEVLRLSGSDITEDARPELIRQLSGVRSAIELKSDMLTDALAAGAAPESTARLDAELDHLRNELAEIRALLKMESPAYTAIADPPPFDVDEFRRSVLRGDSVGLIFSLGDRSSFLWSIDESGVDCEVLAPRADLESKVSRLRALLDSREVQPGESAEAYASRSARMESEYLTGSKALSEDLLGGVAAKLGGKRLVVVPDGKLAYFPLGGLPDPESPGRPLLERHEVVYVPSATAATLITNRRRERSAEDKSLIVFSDPVFSPDDPRLAGAGGTGVLAGASGSRFVESLASLRRLEASKAEGESVASTLAGSSLRTGFAANRDAVSDPSIGEYRILHFATHGFLDEQRPELSGLVFSRFRERGEPRDELIRIADIHQLRLSADLVVLSACHTGVGKEVKGEGLMSLTNAFFRAGASTVVSTLWKVDDDATRDLMRNFYSNLADGRTEPSAALRSAQLEMSRTARFRSPFYWAAFTIHGDPRRVPLDPPRTTAPNRGLLILAVAAVAGYLLLRSKRLRWGTSK